MKHESIQELFEQAAVRFGELPAVERGAVSLSYRELAERSNRLANFLLAAGLTPGTRVVILTEDVIDIITAIIATLKVRGVFVPLDPALPEKRLAALVADVTPEIFISETRFIDRINGWTDGRTRVVCLNSNEFAQFTDSTDPDLATAPDDMCHIYFTSGSTGKPKGISGRLKGISHYIKWETRTLDLPVGTRVSQLITPTFDAFMRDIFVPLSIGGTICVPPDRELQLDPASLIQWLDQQRVNLIHTIPSQFRAILHGGIEPQLFEALRYVLLSGEPLLPADVKKWMSVFGERIQLVNLYGATETTMTKFFYFVKPSDQERPFIPIGQPMPGARALLLDERGRICPPGAIGEIYIRTPFRSLGYWNQPEQTREAFIQNPFSDDPQDVIYKTGDLARLLDDGTFQILGRKDQQVKIRGIRVELEEIENLLRTHAAVKDVAVAALRDDHGFDYLCAYLVTNEAVETRELREFVAQQLPTHSVPSSFVFLPDLPRTANGKLNRPALASMNGARDAQCVAPRNSLEQQLVEIWQEVLGHKDVGIRNNFFEIGGHSLIATRAVSRIHKALNARVELRQFFAHPTIEELAQFVAAAQPAQYVEIPPAPPRDLYEVSNAQRRLWVLNQLEDDLKAYNMCGAYMLEGTLNVPAFTRAFAALVARNESLRTTFVQVDGEPMQRIHAAEDFPFGVEYTDLRNHADRITTARDIANREAAMIFDLACGPLLKARLLRLEDDQHLFVLTMHHIISDGWSMAVLVDQVLNCYQAFRRGDENPLPPLRIQYKDYAVWQRQQLSGAQLETHQNYWWQQLGGEIPVLALPTDFPRPPVKTYSGDRMTSVLAQAVVQDALRLGQQQGASLFMVLLATVNALLYRYTFQQDIIVGSPLAGRERQELEEQIGFYVNTLALRTRPSADDSFSALLDKVKTTTLEAYEHQIYPFDRLVDELRLRRDASRSPLFDVLVVLQNLESGGESPTIEDLKAGNFELDNPVSKFDLSFRFWEVRNELHVQIEYNTDLFKRATIERMLGHLSTLFRSAMAHPEQRIANLPMLTEAEQQQLITWNATRVERAEGESLHRLFEQQTERTPGAIAVVDQDRSLTYLELNHRANQLAHYLRTRGVSRDVRVGVCLERSLEMVIALLGILKAGDCYVPLDPEYPAERLVFMLEDAEVSMLLTSAGLREQLPFLVNNSLCLDSDWEATISEHESGNPSNSTAGDDLAYVIYTSGSTGRPKGAMNTHRAICNRLRWMQEAYNLNAGDRVLQKTPFSFDVSVWEFFWPLITGARLVMARPEGHKDVAYLVNVINEESITTLHFVPSMLQVFVEHGALRQCPHIRRVICSGEALPYQLQQRFFEDSRARLYNLYGPTEAAVDVTAWPCVPEGESGFVPIGKPIANTNIHLLDPNGELVPVGVPGELHIGGVGLARGYLNQPGLTAEKFVPHFHSAGPGERLYKTGDLARYHPGGEIEFLGRLDFQVKVRGFRIELEEVEGALREYPAVREAVVTTVDDEHGAARLVAYVTFDKSTSAPATSELRMHLQQRLPEHMVPSVFMILDEMPLTPNGKIDRSSLPQLDTTPLATEYVEPANDIESKLVAAWEQVLNLKKVGVRDNYFELGGDSIRAIQIAALLHQQGLGIRVRDLFQFPTITAIAPQVKRLRRVADQSLVVGPVMATPFQMDFLATVSPKHRHHFNHGVMLHSRTGFDADALAAAFAKILQHHDALRLTLRSESLTLFNEDAKTSATIIEYDLRESGNSFKALAEKADEIQASLNLETGPLMKLGLIHMPDGDRLVLAVHHLAVDGVSWRILFEDLQTLYQQHVQGVALTLPRKTDSFKSWSEFLAVHANSEEFLVEADYWAAVEETSVPLIERDEERSYVCDEDRVSFSLSLDETDLLLTRVNKAFNTEVHHILLAALGLTVKTCFDHSRVAIAIEGHGREPLQPDLNVSRTVGWFTSIYPVVLDLRHAADLSRFIKNVKETVRRVPHNGIGHGLLKHLTKPELKKHVRFNLAPQITFNYHGQFDADLSKLSTDVVFESPGKLRSQYAERMEELGVSCSIEGKRLHVSISFSRKQHRPEKIEKLCQCYQAALRDVLAHCSNQTTAELTPSDLTYKGLSIEALDQLFMDHS